MAKAVEVTLNGTVWRMPASYKASKEVAERVGDPLQMALRAHATGTVDMTTEQVVDIIAIGVRHAGCSLVRDDIGEAIIDGGLVEYVRAAGEYIGAFVAGGPEKQAAVAKKKD